MHQHSRASRITYLDHIKLVAEDVSILKSSRDFHDNVFTLIKKAKKRIYLSALYLENDTTGKKLLNALYEAKSARPELDVTVLVDYHRAKRGRIGEGKTGGNAEYYAKRDRESAHNIDIYGLPVKKREFFGVMHLKGFVFDDLVLYSGASINDVYFHASNRYRYDRYTLINSRDLADSMVDFIQRLKRESDVITRLGHHPAPSVKSIKKRIRKSVFKLKRSQYRIFCPTVPCALHITPVLGFGRRGNRLNKTIIDMLRIAEESIVLYTPYFNLPSSLRKAIKQAMKRKVKVQIVVGDKTSSDFYIHEPEKFSIIGTLPYFYELLLRGFIARHKTCIQQGLLEFRLWKHQDNSFHVKGVSVDDCYHLLTGNNLNPRAWGLDLENALLLYDGKKSLRDKFQQEHEQILEHTKVIQEVGQLEHPSGYPAPVKKILSRLKRIRADKVLKRFI